MKQYRIAQLILVVLCVASSLAVSSEIPAKKQAGPIALIGGTIHTVSGATIENGTILFDKGKIVALGTQVDIPSGAERIDANLTFTSHIENEYTRLDVTLPGRQPLTAKCEEL